MACAHPLHIQPQVQVRGKFFTYPKAIDVPCGYCVNCRRDIQNYIVDRANYEYCKRLTASFVTFTYNDISLIEHCAVTDPLGGFMYDTDSKGNKQIRTSLNFSDVRKYIHSIREYVKYHPELHGVLCQPDFSYIYCGEYGDKFGRCHFHVLFFGLDFAFCKKLLFERWTYGFVDVLPLLDGGIRYVTKYMDKFEKGLLAEQKYDFKGCARPKMCMSQGFGQGLLWDKIDDIKSHDYTYPVRNIRRPISAYWKKLITGGVSAFDSTKLDWCHKTPEYILKQKLEIARQATELNFHRHNDVMSDSFQKYFKERKARIRERNLIIQIRNGGNPCYDDFSQVMKSRFGFVTYDNKRVRRLPSWKQKILADEYLLHLQKVQLNKYFPLEVVND